MKKIIFDAGPIISLSMNNLLWILDSLKKDFDGEFYVAPGVEYEIVGKPLQTKKFKFEALQAWQFMRKGTLKVYENREIEALKKKLLELGNHCYKIHGEWLNIIHPADCETVAAAIVSEADVMVMDEITTRLMIENPYALEEIFERKFHSDVKLNDKNIKEFLNLTKGVKIIRSFELVTIAFEKGFLDKYKPDIKDANKILLQAVLWGVKLNGCSVTRKEIDTVIREER